MGGGDGGAGGARRARRPTCTIPFQDEHLLVVDKPAGLVVHPARGHETGTLAQIFSPGVAGGGEDAARARIVHRLDRDTSGLLLVARTEDAHRTLQEALRGARGGARVPGPGRAPPAGAHGHDRRPAGPRPSRAHQGLDRHRDVPREAVTHFSVEEVLPAFTLLRVRLETGPDASDPGPL